MTRLSEVQRARLTAWEDRTLTAEEFAARAAAPMSDWEREDFRALVSWFTRRYPTAGQRLRAMRLRLARRAQSSRLDERG